MFRTRFEFGGVSMSLDMMCVLGFCVVLLVLVLCGAAYWAFGRLGFWLVVLVCVLAGFVGGKHLIGFSVVGNRVVHNPVVSEERIVFRTTGGTLEVSAVNTKEMFSSMTYHSVFGLDVGATEASIKVPVTYRYQIQLAKEWELKLVEGGSVLEVIAPNVFPVLPVSLDVSRMEVSSGGVWASVTGDSAIDGIRSRVMEDAAKRAMTSAMLGLQKESARKTVSEFIQKWVVEARTWSGGKPVVRVLFQNEV